MQRLLLSLLGFGMATLLLLLSLWRQAQVEVFQPVMAGEVEVVAKKIQITTTLSQALDGYVLPQPNVLPGNLFYLAKMALDRGELIVTQDPQQLVVAYRQRADQRLAAAVTLLARGDAEAAVIVMTKAEKYLEKSVLQLQALPETPETLELSREIATALAAHERVIKASSDLLDVQAQQVAQQALTLNRQLQESNQSLTQALESVVLN